MRKIESEMVAAVWNHQEWEKANTRVEIKGPHAMVFLHGNHIATLNRFDKCLEFYGGSDSRWFSRTTATHTQRMSAALVAAVLRTALARAKTEATAHLRVCAPYCHQCQTVTRSNSSRCWRHNP